MARFLFDPSLIPTLDTDGVKIGDGAKLHAYAAGTSTPISTYNAATGGGANTWPVVADSAGRFGAVFLNVDVQARIKVTNADESDILYDRSPVNPVLPTDAALYSVLAGTGGAGLIGSTDGQTVQYHLNQAPALGIGLFTSFVGTPPNIASTIIQVYSSGYSTNGVGIARYIYDAAVNAAYVVAWPKSSFLAADGRGFRFDPSQEWHIKKFGGKADCAVDTFTYTSFTASWSVPGGITDNSAALLEMMKLGKHRTLGTVNEGGPMIPLLLETEDSAYGYYFASTIIPPWSVYLKGTNSGTDAYDGVGTTLLFPANTGGGTFNHWDTQPAGYDAIGTGGSILEGLNFRGGGGTDRTKHGLWQRVPIIVRNCTFKSFSGNGTNNVGSAGVAHNLPTFGLTSGTLYERVFCSMNGNYNSYVNGSDCSASTFIGLHHKGSRLGGLFDGGVFANTYIGYQNNQHGDGHVGACSYGGRLYALIDPTAGIGASTTPGTNEAIWEDRGAGVASAAWPAWSALATYELSLPIYITGQDAEVLGYTENYYLPSHAPSTAGSGAMLRGTIMQTRSSSRLGKLDTPHSLSSQLPLTSYRSYSPNDANYATLGTEAYAGIGGDGTTFGFHFRAYEGYVYKHEWVGDNLNYAIGGTGSGLPQIWQISGSGTGARQFGTGAALKGAFNPDKLVIGDGGGPNDNGRLVVYGTAAPTGGAHARGEIVFRSNPSSGGFIGWVCTTAGTPGTWKTWGVIS